MNKKTHTQPDHSYITKSLDIKSPLIGVYNAPDPQFFKPLVKPGRGECVYAFYSQWLEGKTLFLSTDHYGCGGCGRWLFGIQTRSRQDFLSFLVDHEGLKDTHELMDKWIDSQKEFSRDFPYFFIGPLKQNMWGYLKSVSFFVNPDQLSALMIGAQYFSSPEDPPPVIAPFGSGCMELMPFEDLDLTQAAIGTTDIAMRQHLPKNILSFTCTREMFLRICSLDERSFLAKPFLKNLKTSRGGSIG